MNKRYLVVVVILMMAGISYGQQRSSKMKPPLIGEESSGQKRRTADCYFGKKVYELEETWHPDLGSPFGVMYCIRCECMAVQKKKRIAGRTLCRNIKNECPKPTCDEPVLLPGRCCKVCLEEGLGPLKEDVSRGLESDDDDKQAKDFAAVLTKKTISKDRQLFGADMANGRFTFHKRHLYFSLIVPEVRAPPRFLQFLSEDGSILEEQELTTNDYYNATGKICGVWRKVPRIYKQLLREEKLWVALMDDKEGSAEAITGRIARYKALSTELLSAILTPDGSCPGCGGTAAVSMASASNSIHVTVAVAGLLSSVGKDPETLVVRLETLETGTTAARVIEELVTVQKPLEVNVVEIRTVLETAEMRLLLRGQIQLSVHSKKIPELRLRGTVGPRIACDIFDSLVTSAEAVTAEEVGQTASSTSAALGLTWMYIGGPSGSLYYRMRLRGLQSKITRVTIETAPTTKPQKRARIVEDVTEMVSSGGEWINGSVARLSARDLELLYEGELYVNVATEQWPASEIRGRLVPRLAGESHLSTESGPVLLNPVGNGTVSSRAALGWVHVDKECNFHYDVTTTTTTTSSSRSHRDLPGSLTVLELVDIPRISIEPGINPSGASAPGTGSGIMLMDGNAESSASTYGEVAFLPNIRLLEEFSGHQVENSIGDLNKLSLARMDAGVAYLKLTEAPVIGSGNPGAQFQGWLTNVHVPGSCLPYGFKPDAGSAGDTSAGYVFDQRFTAQDDNNEIPLTATARCFYEGKLYEDGSAWTAEHDRCMMCSCRRGGRVVCDPVVCPALNCAPTAKIIQATGDVCCPMCENVTKVVETSTSRRGCNFEGDGKFHPAGSRWHPYLPPFGFSKCAVCVCDPVTLKVECSKLTCPVLSCPDSEAYRPDPMACCKQCPAPTPAPSSTISSLIVKDTLGEEAVARGEADILSSGGCRFKGDVFENGEEWHPRIQPWGEMRCINCNCKDGKVKCKRKKCTRTRCSGGSIPKASSTTSSGGVGGDDCCPSCPEDGLTITTTTTASPSKNNNNGEKKRPRTDVRTRARPPAQRPN